MSNKIFRRERGPRVDREQKSEQRSKTEKGTKTEKAVWNGAPGVEQETALGSSVSGSFQSEDCSDPRFFENQANNWLTTKEAADYMRISPKSLLNLSSNGKVRYYKFGRRNRYLFNDLRELLLGQPRGGSYGN